ncbi:hypothetical protein [Brevibacterium oceani]|uniref:hypothetical protein n=1 Tax=Brevibacterium oceani TaxID=358099 RepID=UPI0015E69728|nr:hypothetical protein [Brevibacterium oceani]
MATLYDAGWSLMGGQVPDKSDENSGKHSPFAATTHSSRRETRCETIRAATTGLNILRRWNMFSESAELIAFRQQLLDGGFDKDETFQLIMTYFEAKVDTRQTEDGMVYLTNGQVDLGDDADG